MGQGDSASILAQKKVWKMREYWMYFPFFILHDWGKRSAEARSSHLSGVALDFPLLFVFRPWDIHTARRFRVEGEH